MHVPWVIMLSARAHTTLRLLAVLAIALAALLPGRGRGASHEAQSSLQQPVARR